MAVLPSGASWEKVVRAVRYVMSLGVSPYTHTPPPRPVADRILLCKGTSDISKGSTGKMKRYLEDTGGTWVDSGGEEFDVFAELGAYSANKKAYVENINGKMRIANTECAS